ncbi:hypothetical protein Dimus_007876, partial [Dionaea muscipula]
SFRQKMDQIGRDFQARLWVWAETSKLVTTKNVVRNVNWLDDKKEPDSTQTVPPCLE